MSETSTSLDAVVAQAIAERWQIDARVVARALELIRSNHPIPYLARYRRDGLMYRGDLITERLIGARSLSELLALAPLPPFAWESVGRCIRAFHEGGYCHADLNAHNVLIDGDGRVHLIDFDRGRQRAPGGWRERNLARLRRSLDKIAAGLPAGRVGPREWDSLVRGYETPPRNPS